MYKSKQKNMLQTSKKLIVGNFVIQLNVMEEHKALSYQVLKIKHIFNSHLNNKAIFFLAFCHFYLKFT